PDPRARERVGTVPPMPAAAADCHEDDGSKAPSMLQRTFPRRPRRRPRRDQGIRIGQMSEYVPVPEHRAATYRRAGHRTGETLAGALLRSAGAQDPNRPALHGERDAVTFGELPQRVERLAAGLLGTGLVQGERVVVQLPNTPDFVILLL